MDKEQVLWIIGVIYSDGRISSVVIDWDEPNMCHGDYFGKHGTRWRTDNEGHFELSPGLRDMTQEERLAVEEHVQKVIDNGYVGSFL